LEVDPSSYYWGDPLTIETCRLDQWLPALKYPERARDRTNLVLACEPCDAAKRDRDPSVHDADKFRTPIAKLSLDLVQPPHE